MSQLRLYEPTSPDAVDLESDASRRIRDKLVFYQSELDLLTRALGLGDEMGTRTRALRRAEKRLRRTRDFLEKLQKVLESARPPADGRASKTLAIRCAQPLRHGYTPDRFTPLRRGTGHYFPVDKDSERPIDEQMFQSGLGRAGLLSVEALEALTRRALTEMGENLFDEIAVVGSADQELALLGGIVRPGGGLHHFRIATWPDH